MAMTTKEPIDENKRLNDGFYGQTAQLLYRLIVQIEERIDAVNEGLAGGIEDLRTDVDVLRTEMQDVARDSADRRATV